MQFPLTHQQYNIKLCIALHRRVGRIFVIQGKDYRGMSLCKVLAILNLTLSPEVQPPPLKERLENDVVMNVVMNFGSEKNPSWYIFKGHKEFQFIS